ncbi:hypothetical protein AVEN_55269-1 [Araneus ventricosus]|uniref:HTH psq-type domain-containing protein n=1 Tax=Araneus ventricosus TaxID=182803 RepID=A0A4Y2DA24_ARAVE|nr:hypothetical protein AVEN_55269-1 [Araneus ventricosus]
MSALKLKRSFLNVKQKLEILQEFDNGESASTDALNEGNTISHSVALQSVEILLDYTGQRGFDCGDITASSSNMCRYTTRDEQTAEAKTHCRFF